MTKRGRRFVVFLCIACVGIPASLLAESATLRSARRLQSWGFYWKALDAYFGVLYEQDSSREDMEEAQRAIANLGRMLLNKNAKLETERKLKEAEHQIYQGLYGEAADSLADVLTLEPQNVVVFKLLTKLPPQKHEPIIIRLHGGSGRHQGGKRRAPTTPASSTPTVTSPSLEGSPPGTGSTAVAKPPPTTASVPKVVQAKGHYNRGLAFYAEAKLEEARTEWQQALELDPSFEKARRALEHLSAEQGLR